MPPSTAPLNFFNSDENQDGEEKQGPLPSRVWKVPSPEKAAARGRNDSGGGSGSDGSDGELDAAGANAQKHQVDHSIRRRHREVSLASHNSIWKCSY